MGTIKSLLIIVLIVTFNSLTAQDNSSTNTVADTVLLGLPGDNLDLYAVLDLFQKSKTIEDFEKSLNNEETGINNLDLNLDDKVDFIKVETKQDKDDFVFVLQVDVVEGEKQDVAAILVSKDKEGNISIQMVGDENLYGKDYVIEPKLETPAVTANPAYKGADTVVVESTPATVIVVESEPIIQYVYSPVYVPYYPPYYYGYYPPYYRPYPVVSITFYSGNNRHYHNHYHGGHYRGGNTVVINNNNTYNNYNRTRNSSNTVNKNTGNYKSNNASNRASKNAKTNNKPNNNLNKSTKPAPSNKSKAKPQSKPSTRPKAKPNTNHKAKPSTKAQSRPSTRQSRPARRPRRR